MITEKYKLMSMIEYETDSDDEGSVFEEHSELVNRACVNDPVGLALFVHLCVSTCDCKR